MDSFFGILLFFSIGFVYVNIIGIEIVRAQHSKHTRC